MLEIQAIQCLGQIQVTLSDSEAYMGHEHRDHPSVAQGEIRMVIHQFGMFRCGDDEAEPARIGREDKTPAQCQAMGVTLSDPIGMPFEKGLHVVRADQILGHAYPPGAS